MILRKAADVQVADTTLSIDFDSLPGEAQVGLQNEGRGIAQVDVYELLALSDEEPEPAEGSDEYPNDLRYIGYRVLPLDDPQCSSVLEIAITKWESTRTLQNSQLRAVFDTKLDGVGEWKTLYNAGYLYNTPYSECRIIEIATLKDFCTGFPPDHATNTANSVLRVCADDIFASDPAVVNFAVGTFTAPTTNITDGTELLSIDIKNPALSAPSFDIYPGGSLDRIQIFGSGRTPTGDESLGLLLFTNAYRDPDNTGAATRETEAIVLTRPGISVPPEVTPDVLVLPKAEKLEGPKCGWNALSGSQCQSRRHLNSMTSKWGEQYTYINGGSNLDISAATPVGDDGICPEQEVPRLSVPTRMPSSTPYPTSAPSITRSPHIASLHPTEYPKNQNSNPNAPTPAQLPGKPTPPANTPGIIASHAASRTTSLLALYSIPLLLVLYCSFW